MVLDILDDRFRRNAGKHLGHVWNAAPIEQGPHTPQDFLAGIKSGAFQTMYYHPMAFTGAAKHDGIERFEQLIDLLAEGLAGQLADDIWSWRGSVASPVFGRNVAWLDRDDGMLPARRPRIASATGPDDQDVTGRFRGHVLADASEESDLQG